MSAHRYELAHLVRIILNNRVGYHLATLDADRHNAADIVDGPGADFPHVNAG